MSKQMTALHQYCKYVIYIKLIFFGLKTWDVRSTKRETLQYFLDKNKNKTKNFLTTNDIQLSHSRNVSWSHSLNITKHKLAKLGKTSTSDSL